MIPFFTEINMFSTSLSASKRVENKHCGKDFYSFKISTSPQIISLADRIFTIFLMVLNNLTDHKVYHVLTSV